MKKDQIRKVIDVIYDEVFNQGQADLYPGLEEVWTNAHKAKENQGANDQ